jgi:drug/metabolite transporter (DMT)-like permease
LTSAIPNPTVYACLIGIAGVFLIVLIPFVDFYVPSGWQLFLSFWAGATFVLALFWFFKALQKFDVSQIVPAVGALTPLFTFFLVYISSGGKETLSFYEIIAFVIMIMGSILVTFEKEKLVNLPSLKLSLIAAFLFSLSFVLTKYVYLEQPFLNGLIWTRLGGALLALFLFVLWPDIKREIFVQKDGLKKKSLGLVAANQAVGAGAGILQNWAIALVPLAYVAFINALQGVQYAFLLILSIFISFKFPQILKEFVSRKIIIQRIIAILLIVAGMILLAIQ